MGEHYQNPIAEDKGEFGKVGIEMSNIQSPVHSDYDSAESIADLQTRILKMENHEKCWLHRCICRIEKTLNPLECQSHRRNLLQ